MLAAVVWLTGAIGGWLNAGHGPRLSAAATATVLIRLPGHLGDPRAAWPAPWPSRLPGAAWLYLIAFAITGLFVGAALLAVVLYRFVRPSALGAPHLACFARGASLPVKRGQMGDIAGSL